MDNFKRIAFAFLATAIFTSFNDVTAQEVEVEEVVVTATRREESLQDVALSAQALTSEDLEAQQVTEMYDLGELTPGITFSPAIGSGYFISIRGSATEAIGASSVGSVQTAVNGHVINSGAFSDMGFLDAARIEILSGPQGTLYGRNVTGGLINVISARPTGETSGYAKMQYGNLGQTRLSSAVNLPVTENVAARVAYSSYVQDGTMKNLNLSTDIDNRDSDAMRLSVDWDMGNDQVLQVTHEEHDFDDSRLNWANRYCERETFLGCNPTVRGTPNTTTHPAGSLAASFGTLTFMQPDKLTDTYAGAPSSDSLNDIYLDLDPRRTGTTTHSTVEFIKSMDNGDLKLKATYGTRDYNHIDDNDKSVGTIQFNTVLNIPFSADLEYNCWGVQTRSTPTNMECSTTEEERQQYEVNWISDNDGPLNYTLGAYMHSRKYMNDYQVQTEGYVMNGDFRQHPYSDLLFGGALDGYGGFQFWANLGGVLTANLTAGNPNAVADTIATIQQLNSLGLNADGTANVFGAGYMQNILPPELRGLINSEHGDAESTSMFGEVYYELDDTTKLTFGLRYDENDNYFQQLNTLGDASAGGAVAAQCSKANGGVLVRSLACGYSGGSAANDAITGKIAIQKALSDDVMVYALYATGNKPGGNSPNESGAVMPYDATDSSNIEFGLRSTLAGGRVLMNATLFQHDAKDAHNSMIYGTSAITNTIDYVHTGLEIQSRFLLGENTSIDFNLFALDSEIGDESLYDPANPFGLSTGQRLSPIATNGPGFSNLVQAPGFGEQLYGLLGSAAPFCNFAAFAEGIVGKCQGVFVVTPAILALPGFAQIARVDLSGNRMPGTRELDYNISLNHMMMTENGSLDWRATMSKKSDMYASLFNLERSRVPEQTYFDMITTYRPNNGDWYVGVYGKNLADDRQLIGIDRGSEVEGSVLNATIGAPRTYGVNFGINF